MFTKQTGGTNMARPKKAPDTQPAAVPAAAASAKASTKRAPVEKVEEIYLQAGGEEWNISDCRERAAAAYTAAGHRASSIKKLVLYIKPEERKMYYVINDKENGSIDL